MGNIASLTSQISSLEQKIASLETKFSSLGGVVSAAETRMAAGLKQGQTTMDAFANSVTAGASKSTTAMQVFGGAAGTHMQRFEQQVQTAIPVINNMAVAVANGTQKATTAMMVFGGTAGTQIDLFKAKVTTAIPVIQNMAQTIGTSSQRAAGYINELGIAGSRLGSSFNGPGGALAQFNGQLDQLGSGLGRTTAAMDNTQRSGNRLAEIFRGNRGLVFGASALFGTLTGIAFELQLVNDANMQVAESQAVLNDLVAQGKEGSAQYSQAQQALGKDQRFLEFSSRNLALAFTNLIPDVILIINGILGIKDKLGPATAAMNTAAVSATTSTVAYRSMGIAAATSATPLGILGVTGRTTAVSLNGAAASAITLRTALLGVGLGAAGITVAALGLYELVKATEDAVKKVEELSKSLESLEPGTSKFYQLKADVAKAQLEIPALKGAAMLSPLPTVGGGLGFALGDIVKDLQHDEKVNEVKAQLAKTLEGLTKDIEIKADGSTVVGSAVDMLRSLPSEIEGPALESYRKLNAILDPKNKFPNFSKEHIDSTVKVIDENTKTLSEALKRAAEIHSAEVAAYNARDEALALQSFELDKARAMGRGTGGTMADVISKTSGKGGTMEIPQEEISKKQQYIDQVNAGVKSLEEYNAMVSKIPPSLRALVGVEKEHSTQIQTINGVMTVYDSKLAQEEDLINRQAEALTSYSTVAGTTIEFQKALVDVGTQVVGGLDAQANAISATNAFWGQMNPIISQNIDAYQNQIIAGIDVTKALTNETYQRYLLKQGIIDGDLAAQSWLDTSIRSAAATKILHDDMVGLVSGFTELPGGIMFTTEQLQAMGEEFLRTGTTAEAQMQAMQDIFGETRGAVQDLMSAAAEGGKEWRDAWKDLDKSMIPKKERSETKDWIEDLVDVDNAVSDLATTMGLFQSQADFGMLDAKEWDRWEKEAKEGLRNVRSEIEDLGAMGETLGPQIVDPFLKLFEDGLTTDELNLITQFTNKFKEISELPGPITPDQLSALDAYGKSLLAANSAQEKLIELRASKDYVPTSAEAELEGQAVFGTGQHDIEGKEGEDPKLAATNAQIEANNILDQTIAQIITDTGLWTKANNLLDKTVAQIIKDVNLWVKGNNVFDSTVAQIITDTNLWVKANNLLDKTVAQLIKDVNLWVKGNNTFDRTVAQIITDTELWIKANNILDRTVAQLITDEGLLSKTTNTLTKATSGADKAFDNAASSAKSFTSSLKKLESQARATAKAIKAIPGGGGGSGGLDIGEASTGMHTNLEKDTIILAHAGERVDIGQTGADSRRGRGSSSGGSGGDTVIHLTEHNHIIVDGHELEVQTNKKTFKRMNSR